MIEACKVTVEDIWVMVEDAWVTIKGTQVMREALWVKEDKMPTVSYTTRVSKRGDAVRGILASVELTSIVKQEGTPVEKLTAMSEFEQAGKAADTAQRTKQAEAKTMQDAFDIEYGKLLKEYTIFRQRRETRKAELKAPEHQKLLAALSADYSRKIQIERVNKEGKTTVTTEESEAASDRLAEVIGAIAAVVASSELVKSFTAVEYGEDKLNALKGNAEKLQRTQKEIQKVRSEAEASTQKEHEAVSSLNELWSLYGPGLRRASSKSPAIKALLQST